jgi:hypothetical protein
MAGPSLPRTHPKNVPARPGSGCHNRSVPSLDTVVTADDSLAVAWLKDLAWFRSAYRPSRLRWFPEHAINVFTEVSRGQLEWTTVADLQRLSEIQDTITDWRYNVQAAQVRRLHSAYDVIGDWAAIADALSTCEGEIEHLIQVDAAGPPRPGTSFNIHKTLLDLPWANPLIECWELRQLVDLYQAAYFATEDTLCDLVVELWDTRPMTVLADAAGCSADYLRARIEGAREQRGGPGDPRRLIRQRVRY